MALERNESSLADISEAGKKESSLEGNVEPDGDENERRRSTRSGQGDANEEEMVVTFDSSFWDFRKGPVRQIVDLSLPIIVSEVFQNTLPIVDLAFVGRLLTKEDLAAAALATVWFNLWNATMLGFCTAVDTLLSQALGAQQYTVFASWTGNGLALVMVASCVMAALLAVCGPVMVGVGQDPDISRQAGAFSLRLIPGIFPLYAFKILVKNLQTQNILWPGVAVGMLANGFNILANWALISALGMGLNGAPIATTLTRWIEFILIVGYFYYHKLSPFLVQTWPIWEPRKLLSTENHHDGTRSTTQLGTFLRLGAAGALAFSTEAWSFEITTILAGLLGTTELDAHIITLSIATFLYLSFPFSVSIAASIQCGQHCGGGRPEDARRSSQAAFLLTLVVQVTLIIIVLPSSKVLGQLFSSDEDVSELVAALLPLSCIFMLGDSIQSTTGGVLRGMGRQSLVFWLNVVGFWVLGVPIGAILTFVVGLGVSGLWWGFSVGIYASGSIGLLFLVYRIDWQMESINAKNRVSMVPASSQPTIDEPSERHSGVVP